MIQNFISFYSCKKGHLFSPFPRLFQLIIKTSIFKVRVYNFIIESISRLIEQNFIGRNGEKVKVLFNGNTIRGIQFFFSIIKCLIFKYLETSQKTNSLSSGKSDRIRALWLKAFHRGNSQVFYTAQYLPTILWLKNIQIQPTFTGMLFGTGILFRLHIGY